MGLHSGMDYLAELRSMWAAGSWGTLHLPGGVRR